MNGMANALAYLSAVVEADDSACTPYSLVLARTRFHHCSIDEL
jgi:hypothetical protein